MKKLLYKCHGKPYIILFVVFVLSIIPMIFLGIYTYPQADDFVFSGCIHNIWKDTHSLINVIKQATITSVYYWKTWAGTFSSVFFFTLQPEAFLDRGYIIVPLLFIGMLSASIWLFVNTVTIRVMRLNKNIAKTVASFVMIYVIWNMPYACQAFYWYNSASHYILSFSMMLITISLVIIANTSKRKAWCIILASVTGIMVGGGNFISALLMAIIYVGVVTFYVYRKKKNMIVWLIPIIIFYVSFVLNVMAPGNAERQFFLSLEPANPISSIMNSFGYSLHFCFSEWINIFLILFIIMLVPIVWKDIEKSIFEFKYPVLVIILSFCLVSAMFAPAAYAENSASPGRAQNIIFSFYIICLFIDEVYLLGWIKKKNLKIDVQLDLRYFYGTCIVLALFFAFTSYKYDEQYNNVLTSLSIIKNGTGKEYATIVGENMYILNSDAPVVTIHKVVEGPVFFYSKEIDDWKSGTKIYFNKELIEYDE